MTFIRNYYTPQRCNRHRYEGCAAHRYGIEKPAPLCCIIYGMTTDIMVFQQPWTDFLKAKFVDYINTEIGETVDIHSEVPRHVETVCQLVLRKPVVHVDIDVDVEELVQDKRGLASYEQIKAYVLEHSGFKVSHLYIAQVKRKCGIIERENYNKPKSEDSRQPQCPPEKEAAIVKALRHFGMIDS